MPITTLNYIKPTSPDPYLERTGYDQATGARLAHLHPIIDKINQLVNAVNTDGYQGTLPGTNATTPIATKDEYWIFSTPGQFGGASGPYVEAGDELISIADSPTAVAWDPTKFMTTNRNIYAHGTTDALTIAGSTTADVIKVTAGAANGIHLTGVNTGADIKIDTGTTGVGLYINKTSNTAGTMKIHCHQLSATGVDYPNMYANEFKGEFLAVAPASTCDGIASHFHSVASGATILRSVLGVAYLDSGITMTGTDATANGWINGGMFVADIAGVLAGTTVVAGLYAGIGSCQGGTLTTFSNLTSLYVTSNRLTVQGSGVTSLILATNPAGTGKQAVNYGLRMESGSLITTGISLYGGYITALDIPTACTTGISISGANSFSLSIRGTLALTTGKAITSITTIQNSALTDGVGVNEFELDLTGTATGANAASSSWVNIITGTATGLVCAQTNGVYEEATGTISGATVVFGMRMQSLLAEVPAESYPFSCVSNTNIITALFSCNAGSSDMGTVTATKAGTGKYVPLYKETSTGQVYYVLLYQ